MILYLLCNFFIRTVYTFDFIIGFMSASFTLIDNFLETRLDKFLLFENLILTDLLCNLIKDLTTLNNF